jgi:hypothetical protein
VRHFFTSYISFKFALVAALALNACTATRQVLRSDIRLHGDGKQTQDGLSIEAAVKDIQSMGKDARLSKKVDAVRRTDAGPVEMQLGWILLNPPAFQVKVTNTTGHVVKMTGAVFKLIDQAGNLYDATTKDRMAAQQADAISTLEGQGITLTPASKSQLNAAVRNLKLLDSNTEFLPDMSETFFLSFDIGVEPTEQAVNQWLSQQAALRLKIYEVPTQTDPAGAITKRVAFEFPVDVKTVRETYEDSMIGGSKLVSSESVSK